MLLRSIAVLTAANILNNKIAPRLGPLTSTVATAALVAMARRSGVSWKELGFEHGRRGAVAGGVLAAAVAGVYAAGVAMPRTRPLFHDDRALSLSRARVLEEALIQVPLGTVLLEEVGFRGALYGMLRRRHGTAAATAVSSTLFGLWHILPAIDMARANPALGALTAGESPGRLDTARVVAGSVVSTAAAGVLFCELRRRRGLVTPVMLHLATNSLGYAFARLAAKLPDPGAEKISHPK
ncbi:membrane protease YdiL (CAAX protease family) [Nonomuraea thailandensis]|uniref:Membrane protease YdiL (CAAX protease family) n=1 Tax=Nonomuraea thailandensis TaxID=1188745 RepID=A0A9X2K9R0_9ACTN|nr:CPBP family intramembrane glutamic endopeptidase [Nonomuraea thailandensis]MCP2362096.1 membrane protease YdiL (CAAX protease family) [Nonomuraea thailandensis]